MSSHTLNIIFDGQIEMMKEDKQTVTDENQCKFPSEMLNLHTCNIHNTKPRMFVVNILTVTFVLAPRAQPAACSHVVWADTQFASPASQQVVMLTMKLLSWHQLPSLCTQTE
jgi:hypothetical protein